MWRIHLWDHYRNRKIRLILLSCLCNPYSTTQGVYQWSTTMSNCLFTIFTLQLPWGSAPRGQHQPKSIRTTPCDITYIIHIHKSLHTNSPPPRDARVSIEPWTRKNTLVMLIIGWRGRKIHRSPNIWSAFQTLDKISDMLKDLVRTAGPSIDVQDDFD